MSTHKAKVDVLRRLSDNLRTTINGDMEKLRFKLYSEDLIAIETRDGKDAGKMVSDIQYRLDGEEAVWDKLVDVLNECNKEQLVKDLLTKLEMCQERTAAGRKETREFAVDLLLQSNMYMNLQQM